MAGQPTKYKPEYCDALIVHLTGGLSFESYAGVIGVSRDSLYEWAKRHRAFSDAKKIGEMRGLLWWETISKAAMLGKPVKDRNTGEMYEFKNFNTTVWVFCMKNRFGWRDGIDIKGKFKSETSKADPKAALKKKRAENQARLDEIKNRVVNEKADG